MLQTLRGLSFIFVFATLLSSSLSSAAEVGRSSFIRHIDDCPDLEAVKALFGLEYVVGKVSSEEVANVLDFKGEIAVLRMGLSPFLWNKRYLFGNLGYSLLLHFSGDSIANLIQSLANAEIFLQPYNALMHKELIIHYLTRVSKWDSDKSRMLGWEPYYEPVIRALSGHELLGKVCSVFSPSPSLGRALLSLEYTETDHIKECINAALQYPKEAMQSFLDSSTAGFNESIRSRNEKLFDSIASTDVNAEINLSSLKAINNIKFGNQAQLASIDPYILGIVMINYKTPCIELISARTDIDWLQVLTKQHGRSLVAEMAMNPKITPDISVAMEFIKHSRSTVPIRERFEDCLFGRVDDLSPSRDAIGLYFLLKAAIARNNCELIEKITKKIFEEKFEPYRIYEEPELRTDFNKPFHPVYRKAFIENFPTKAPEEADDYFVEIVYTALSENDPEILGLLKGHKNRSVIRQVSLKRGHFPIAFMPRLIEALGYSEKDFTAAIWNGQSDVRLYYKKDQEKYVQWKWTGSGFSDYHCIYRYLYKKNPNLFQLVFSQSIADFHKLLELPEFEESPKKISSVMVASIGLLVLVVVATVAYFISRRQVKQQM